jgi:CDP-paratose 2-epimerase
MAVAIVTGSAGLIGSDAVRFLAQQGMDVVGIDNDMRKYFFGSGASTSRNRRDLDQTVVGYRHFESDIRDKEAIEAIFSQYAGNIALVIHAAAQPSHDWAATEPLIDFTVNANGTLNLLEATRKYCPDAVFIFVSTNKVYGDTPNRLPLIEFEKRWEIADDHAYYAYGIDESMSIDQTLHSLFGASKSAADLLVQEYGRYFGMKTACFRAGCLTGPSHAAAELHGFLAYLVKCAVEKAHYTVYGYKGKQVRDNLHAYDLVQAFWHFFENPRSGEVYNIGGGRQVNCSMLEAIEIVETVCQCSLNWSYRPTNRIGDHIWWISDTRKFRSHYPAWQPTYGIERIIAEIGDAMNKRLSSSG